MRSGETWARLKATDPYLAECLALGRSLDEDEVAGVQRARGVDIRCQSGMPAAAQYLKVRHHWEEKVSVEVTANVQLVSLPGMLPSGDDYQRWVEARLQPDVGASAGELPAGVVEGEVVAQAPAPELPSVELRAKSKVPHRAKSGFAREPGARGEAWKARRAAGVKG